MAKPKSQDVVPGGLAAYMPKEGELKEPLLLSPFTGKTLELRPVCEGRRWLVAGDKITLGPFQTKEHALEAVNMRHGVRRWVAPRITVREREEPETVDTGFVAGS